MRGTIRLGLLSAGFGLWMGFCASALFSLVLWEVPPPDTTSVLIGTVAVATLGWLALHVLVRQPGPGTYIALAAAVVVVLHLTLAWDARTEQLPLKLFLGFILHYWLTVPCAVGATGLFVWCLRRWKML